MAMANLSEQTGWTLTQIRNEPAWFIRDVQLLKQEQIRQDNLKAKAAARKSGKGKGRGR